MGKQSIPWAVGLTGLLYFGMLGYWQSEAFETALGLGGNASSNAVDGAIFGFTFGVAYVAFLIWCFVRDMPEGLKEVPVIGRYGKVLVWLGFFRTLHRRYISYLSQLAHPLRSLLYLQLS